MNGAVFNYFYYGTVPNSTGNIISTALIYFILGFGRYCLYKSVRMISPTTKQLATTVSAPKRLVTT